MTLCAINRNTGESVYRQICRILEQEIKSTYEAGDYLPVEVDLAARFSVNRHTLRRAVDELVSMGLVERQHGRGNLILGEALEYKVGEKTRFTERLESLGRLASTTVIRKIVVPAYGGVARRLAIKEDSFVLMLETLRKVDNRPFCVISHFIPLSTFPDFETDYQGGSLHSLFEQKYAISPIRKESMTTACLPLGDDAVHLLIPKNFPILRVKSVNIDAKTQRPVEYSITRFRSDRVQLSFTP